MSLSSSYSRETNAPFLNNPHGESASIAMAELDPGTWGTWCDWLTHNLQGLETTIERRDRAGKIELECLSKPLDCVSSRTTDNGVLAIAISVRMDRGSYTWEVAGPRLLAMYRSAAGWPTRIEIGFHEGALVLEFTGSRLLNETLSGNGWGE